MVRSCSLDIMDCLVDNDQEYDMMKFFDFPMESFEEGDPNGEDWLYDVPSFPVTDDKNAHLKQHPVLYEEPSKSSIPLHNDLSVGLKKDLFRANEPVTEDLKSVLKSTSPTSVSNCVHSGLSEEPNPVFVSGLSRKPNSVSVSKGVNSGVFQAPSPDSVLESGQSCSGEKTILPPSETSAPASTRSKRIRKTTYKMWFESGESFKKKPKKEKKLSQLLGDLERKDTSSTLCSKQPTTATKRCMHCEVSKTPQWREGPMGPKTLCNACGVRYRSGRLFPEYRPLTSPTFVPNLHSNSHRKVIEMRKRCSNDGAMAETESAFSGSTMAETGFTTSDRAMSPPPEFVPWDNSAFPPHEFVSWDSLMSQPHV